jgi:exodeoxyribonuclease-3
MKIVSWNVNSLRSAEEPFLKYLAADQPDILMVQELRAEPDQLSFFLRSIPGYEAIFNPSGRPGYAGTALYLKENISPEKLTTRTGNHVLDTEGRTIHFKQGNLQIFNFYTPNGNSGDQRLQFKLTFYEQMRQLSQILKMSGQSVIFGGDLNTAHTDLDVHNPQTAVRTSGFLPQERQAFSELLATGLADSFRLLEKGGGFYTWWNLADPTREQNRGWRYDYFLVSADLREKVKSVRHRKDVFGSDHCPIELEIDI